MKYSPVTILSCLLLTSFVQVTSLPAQTKQERESYIRKYAELAVKEMHFSGIPASITLAQGLLESTAGTSELARTANNHFGIKCQMEWQGPRYYYDDDEKNDCFRAYKTVEESYRDHSLFLMHRQRYSDLFRLDPTDYKSWAHGLKKAGYATNPRYAHLLIHLIDENKLYQFDRWMPEMESINSTAGV
ncbi:MAG: glucosaminidase domain-containing protein, partial [Bacteroidales bacterium]|nr:glucosaminidase domain-containing protein [Bacteroidales bacterium]